MEHGCAIGLGGWLRIGGRWRLRKYELEAGWERMELERWTTGGEGGGDEGRATAPGAGPRVERRDVRIAEQHAARGGGESLGHHARGDEAGSDSDGRELEVEGQLARRWADEGATDEGGVDVEVGGQGGEGGGPPPPPPRRASSLGRGGQGAPAARKGVARVTTGKRKGRPVDDARWKYEPRVEDRALYDKGNMTAEKLMLPEGERRASRTARPWLRALPAAAPQAKRKASPADLQRGAPAGRGEGEEPDPCPAGGVPGCHHPLRIASPRIADPPPPREMSASEMSAKKRKAVTAKPAAPRKKGGHARKTLAGGRPRQRAAARPPDDGEAIMEISSGDEEAEDAAGGEASTPPEPGPAGTSASKEKMVVDEASVPVVEGADACVDEAARQTGKSAPKDKAGAGAGAESS